MSIILNGSRTCMLLPRKERPDEFRKYMSMKRSNDLKVFCDHCHRKVQACVSEMYIKGLIVNPNTIKSYIRGEYVTVYTVGMLVNEYLGILKNRVDADDLTMGVYFKYERVANRLLEKVGGTSDVSCITKSVVLGVLTDLRATMQPATVSNYWTKLKTIIRYAVDNGKLQINPCLGIKVPKGEKEVKTLSPEDYAVIRDKSLYPARLEKVRDLFVFCCNSGLAYCDVISLKNGDFIERDGRWVVEKERKKTGVRFYSVILDDGVKILEKYDFDLSKLFISNQRCNSYLKAIQDICQISSVDSLHFHLARHTYATMLIRAGVPVSVVQMAVGHKNLRQTQHYSHLVASDVVQAVSQCLPC